MVAGRWESLPQEHGVAGACQAGDADRPEDAYAAAMMFRAGPKHAEIPGKVALCQGCGHASERGLHAVDPQGRTDCEGAAPAMRPRRSRSTRPRLDIEVWPEAAPVDRRSGLQSAQVLDGAAREHRRPAVRFNELTVHCHQGRRAEAGIVVLGDGVR